MKISIEHICKRSLHCMVFLRILEKLNIRFLILHVCGHRGLIKDTREHASVIHLLIISLRRFLHILVFLHTVIQVFDDNPVRVSEFSHEFLIDALNDLIQRTEFFFFCASPFRIGWCPRSGLIIQFNRAFEGLGQMVVFQFHAVIKVKLDGRVARKQLCQIGAEDIFVMKFLKASAESDFATDDDDDFLA